MTRSYQYEDQFAMSQPEVAQALGISRQRVSQIERDALRKVREAFADRGIVGGDFFDDLESER